MAQAVYDKEDEKEKSYGAPDKEGSHDDLGVHPERREAEIDDLEKSFAAPAATDKNAKASSPEDIKSAEESGAGFNDSPKSDGDSIPYSEEEKNFKQKVQGLLTKRNVTGGVITVAILGGGFGAFSFLQGPAQILGLSQTFSNLFFSRNNNTNDTSARRIYNTISGKRENNNLGPLASKLATNQRARLSELGIEPKFETENGKGRAKIQAFEVDTKSPAGKSMLEIARAENASITDIGGDRVRIDVRGGEGGRVARVMTARAVELDGKKGISGFVSKRRLRRLFGTDFHPLNIAKRATESMNDYIKRRRGERAKEASTGKRTRSTGDVTSRDGEEPVDGDIDGENRDIKSRIDDINNEPDLNVKKSKLRALRASSLLKGGAAGAAIVAVVCAVRDIGKNIQEYKSNNVLQPLIRLTIQYIAAGSQVQAMQDINMAELATISDALYDEGTPNLKPGDEGYRAPSSWSSAKPLKAANGESGGTDINPSTRSQIISTYNNEKPGVFSLLDDIPGLGTACGVNSWFGNLPILKEIGAVGDALVGKLSSLLTGRSVEDWMGDLVAALSGEAIDTLAEGAELGNLLSYGSFMSANASAIAMGGAALSASQAAEWNQYNNEVLLAEQSNRSWTERLFDITSPHTLANSLLVKSSEFGSNPLASIIHSGPVSAIQSSFKNVGSMFTTRAFAQTAYGYDYGIPMYGVPLSLLESPRYEDVYENIDRLEDNNFAKLKAANKQWGKCFNNPLDDKSNIIDKKVKDYSGPISGDCKAAYGNQDFQDYQMYILDNVTIRSLACYEGIDETQCKQLGFGAGAVGGAVGSTGPTNETLYMVGDSLTVGMKSGGLDEKLSAKGYVPTTDGLVSRGLVGGVQPDGLTKIQQDSEAIKTAGTIVVALGTNDSAATLEEELRQVLDLIRSLSSSTQVYFVNYVGGGTAAAPQKEKTDILAAFASQNNVKVIDWASTGGQYVNEDTSYGVHPYSNYDKMADVIANSLPGVK